jgi:hypothetical protein
MKSSQPASTSRNSDPIYSARLPSRASTLPSTERRIISGIETGPARSSTNDGLFGGQVRHYNLVSRPVSSPALTLSPYVSAELEGAILLACGEGSVDTREGVPSMVRGREFRVSRSADLFFGGTITELAPGVYSAGDTIVDRASGRVYLELDRDGVTHVGVIGLFMTGRLPSCVDWRVVEAAQPGCP